MSRTRAIYREATLPLLADADDHLDDLHGIERRAFPERVAADEEVEAHFSGWDTHNPESMELGRSSRKSR